MVNFAIKSWTSYSAQLPQAVNTHIASVHTSWTILSISSVVTPISVTFAAMSKTSLPNCKTYKQAKIFLFNNQPYILDNLMERSCSNKTTLKNKYLIYQSFKWSWNVWTKCEVHNNMNVKKY